MILSGRTDVSFSADTVRKVRETAEALGYAPTAKKRPSLFDRKTVLIVCPNVLNPYYSTIVQAIQQAAADKDCDTLVYTTYRDAENEIRILNAVAGSDLAGVVFTMMPQSTELVERVNRLVPVVVIGDRNTSLNVDTVEMNNYSAGAIIAHYMIGLGHKHIAYISTTLNEANSARVRRLEGVRDTYRNECPEGSVIVRSREVTPKEERDNISIEHAVGFELTRQMPRRAAHHGLCGGQRHGGLRRARRHPGRGTPGSGGLQRVRVRQHLSLAIPPRGPDHCRALHCGQGTQRFRNPPLEDVRRVIRPQHHPRRIQASFDCPGFHSRPARRGKNGVRN